MSIEEYPSVRDRVQEIESVLQASARIDEALDFTVETRLLKELTNQLDRSIAVAVVGEFSTGKSTFINAVLGRALLPARYVPTTMQTMRINHKDGPGQVAIAGSSDPADRRPLSRDAIAELAQAGSALAIETPIPPPWSNLVIYDTPGVNDAADMAESVLFDLMDQVDVVVFMLRADRALTESEAAFLGRLVRQKDLDKFFFDVNFADTLDSTRGAHERVRQRVIENLGRLRNWPFKTVGERVFLCSASEALAVATSPREGVEPAHTNEHDRLVTEVHRYAQTCRDSLLATFADNVVRSAARSSAEKLSAAIDVAIGKDGEYAEALATLTSEMSDLRASVRDHEVGFAHRVRELKQALLIGVDKGFVEMRADLHAQVMKSGRADLADGTWLQKRLRVEAEDRLRAIFTRFSTELEDAVKDLDQGVLSVARQAADRFEAIRGQFDFAPWLAGGGVAVAAYTAATAALPWVAAGAAAAAFASFLPGVGAIIVGLLTAFAPQAGAAAVSVTQAVYGWVRDRLRDWQDSQTRDAYCNQLDSIITRMKDEVSERIRRDIDPDRIAREITDARFPQAQTLDDRRVLATKLDRARLRKTLPEIRELRERLVEVASARSLSHE